MIRKSSLIRIDAKNSEIGAWDRDTGADYPRDTKAHIQQAFANVEATLKLAGGTGWDQVYLIRSYHVGMTQDALEVTAQCLKEYTPDHAPLWTAIGVEKLAFPEMRIEIEVKAHVSPKDVS